VSFLFPTLNTNPFWFPSSPYSYFISLLCPLTLSAYAFCFWQEEGRWRKKERAEQEEGSFSIYTYLHTPFVYCDFYFLPFFYLRVVWFPYINFILYVFPIRLCWKKCFFSGKEERMKCFQGERSHHQPRVVLHFLGRGKKRFPPLSFLLLRPTSLPLCHYDFNFWVLYFRNRNGWEVWVSCFWWVSYFYVKKITLFSSSFLTYMLI